MKQTNQNIEDQNEFKIPKGYFETVEDAVFEKLSQSNLLNKEGFEIPKGYFETVEDTVFEKLNLSTKKEVNVLSLQYRILKYAAVAVIILMVGSQFFNKTNHIDKLAINDIEHYLDENAETFDINTITENFDSDELDLLHDFNTDDIYNQLDNVNIEAILDDMDDGF